MEILRVVQQVSLAISAKCRYIFPHSHCGNGLCGVIPSKLVALIIAPVAQLVEQWPFKPLAGGSSPPGRTTQKHCYQRF